MSTPDEPALPDVTGDERETGWGDDVPTEDDDIRRLNDERPPHHDRD